MKKRTAFETALVRRIAKKSDFIRYAAYEMGLEQLRRKRMERLSCVAYTSLGVPQFLICIPRTTKFATLRVRLCPCSATIPHIRTCTQKVQNRCGSVGTIRRSSKTRRGTRVGGTNYSKACASLNNLFHGKILTFTSTLT